MFPWLVLIALAVGSTSFAATIRGMIQDEGGGPIDGPTVLLESPDGSNRRTSSSGGGRFAFAGVPAGSYSLKIGLQWFYDVVVEQVVVNGEADRNLVPSHAAPTMQAGKSSRAERPADARKVLIERNLQTMTRTTALPDIRRLRAKLLWP